MPECDQCGKPFVAPRSGSQRKRFCSGACRAKWSRSQKPKKLARPVTDPLKIAADLAFVYDELMKDIRIRGAVVGDRVNPSVEALRKVAGELSHYAVATEVEPEVDELEKFRTVARTA